jgi:hypothetical protein
LNGSKLRLVVAAALFVGWLAWLGYTALAKNRGPVVSHVQVEAAAHAVVAEVKADADGKPDMVVKVTESLKPNSPAAGTELYLLNIGDAKGFDGPGEYLLLLTDNVNPRDIPLNGKNLPMRALVGMQRSPGYEASGPGGALIYRMSDGVRAQFQKLTR